MNGILENIGFYNSLNNTIKAVILLVMALLVALIARAIVKTIVKKIVKAKGKGEPIESPEAAETEKSKRDIVNILSNLTFAIVFIVFLPGALEKLGLMSVISPIQSMGEQFLNFLPNIVAAILILSFGIFLSKFVRDLVCMGLKKTKLDSLQKKCGIKDEEYSFSEFISKIIYAILMIIFAVASVKVLNLEAISGPATSMVESVMSYIPLIFAASILIIFGVFLGNIIGGLLGGVLSGTNLDSSTAKLFPKKSDGSLSDIKASKMIATIVKVIIDVIFVVSGVKVLNIEVLTNIGTTFIAYMPSILAAIIILLVAWICANKASELILKAEPESTGLALLAKVAIFAFAAFMAVQQLGIATTIVNLTFGCIVGAAAVAFAIAFGVGGRTWAGKKLEEIDNNMKDRKAKQIEKKDSSSKDD